MFLAIDTSSEQTSVSLGNLDCGLREFNSLSSERFGEHAEELSLLVSRLLKESGLSIADLDGVTLTTGPGSFTGIRIGLSYAKGICSACSIPLYSFDTLQSAYAALALEEELFPQLYFFIMDARGTEVFLSGYQHDRNRSIFEQCVVEPHLVDLFQVREVITRLELERTTSSRVYALGTAPLDGLEAFQVQTPLSQGALLLTAECLSSPRQTEATHTITPLYIRPVSAKTLKERGIHTVDILGSIDY
ncbi:MAG: tRNA (adenosine(37)-N6)-threonylcarbamoyltransferase complex dimerization subunit type 1 TsaB [Bdellovibrionales bacterium]|nr:tRNA (adenosine(37)-N6)-threonylcarbamoyltransferase complex dimerization subunit type 1 TsaB [Bdellovibrionales bacterium]